MSETGAYCVSPKRERLLRLHHQHGVEELLDLKRRHVIRTRRQRRLAAWLPGEACAPCREPASPAARARRHGACGYPPDFPVPLDEPHQFLLFGGRAGAPQRARRCPGPRTKSLSGTSASAPTRSDASAHTASIAASSVASSRSLADRGHVSWRDPDGLARDRRPERQQDERQRGNGREHRPLNPRARSSHAGSAAIAARTRSPKRSQNSGDGSGTSTLVSDSRRGQLVDISRGRPRTRAHAPDGRAISVPSTASTISLG